MKRGAALGSVLMVISLMVLFAFVLTGSSVFHIRMSWHESVSQEAADDAEAGLAATIDYFLAQPSATKAGASQYSNAGQDGTTPADLLAKLKACNATITFNPADDGHDIYTSINNLPKDSDSPTDPTPLLAPYPDVLSGHPAVPSNGLFLCTRSTVRGVSRMAIAIVSFPQFQYAIASSGTIVSRGGLEVDSTENGQVLQKNGNLVSNSAAMSWAVQLHQGDLVTGNAQATGRIDAQNAKVMGVINEVAPPVQLPSVDPTTLDPENPDPKLQMPLAGTYDAAHPLPAGPLQDGIYKFSGGGTLTVTDLVLNQAVLYVDGSLTVTQHLKGAGVVVVTGTTTVHGNVDMTAAGNDQIALVSG
ncbi:MAG: hypothetical protein ACYCW6_29830, partial [Candidatus Xenobia bacterium]